MDEAIKDQCKQLYSRIKAWAKNAGVHISPKIAQAAKESRCINYTLPLDDDNGCSAPDDQDIDADSDDEEPLPTNGKRSRPAKDSVRPKKHCPLWREVSGIEIMLPSSCVEAVRKHACMQVLVETEYKIRVGQANDGLNSVRTHLITSHAFDRFKTNLNGQAAVTRQRARIMKKHGYIRRGASCYRRAYRALLSLGLPSGNSMGFKVLLWGDVKAFTVNTGAQQLGDSRERPSWIWENLPFFDNEHLEDNVKEYSQDAVRVHWFRVNAVKDRWSEEAALLEEEMRRTVRFFRFQHHQWLDRSRRREREGEHGHAAYAKKHAHRYERLLQECTKRFSDFVDMAFDYQGETWKRSAVTKAYEIDITLPGSH
ncbi:hypothetical protein PHLCEN_2v4819 [Hermanssonia centrifuga]|uniref:Uncharacterized protein n=1 Tax=Hermanssonia centrifuga TaxID=98765 RepID=A0A2R6PG88_9APHY|nr:hypothetical protein PHLCEN_2v4819 [Hermanssonia centrifuga]